MATSEPKMRPIELNRQKRVMELYGWGKTTISTAELFDTIALQRLTNKAMEDYGVTYPTGSSYAKVVLARLRREAVPA